MTHGESCKKLCSKPFHHDPNMNAISIPKVEAEAALLYGIQLTEVTPRLLRVTGPNGTADIRRGAGDGQLRLFSGNVSCGVMSELYIFEEAFSLVSHRYSREKFHEHVAVAQEGEESSAERP